MVTENDGIPGIREPGHKFCPLTTQIAVLYMIHFQTQPNLSPTGYQLEVKTMKTKDEEFGTTVLSGDVLTTLGDRRAQIEAYKTNALRFLSSPPPRTFRLYINEGKFLRKRFSRINYID